MNGCIVMIVRVFFSIQNFICRNEFMHNERKRQKEKFHSNMSAVTSATTKTAAMTIKGVYFAAVVYIH